MKELSIEEKARRYDEAIERANNLHKDAVEMENNMTTKTCEIIFPELKESEDERIRNALLEMVHDTTGDSLWIDYNVHKEDALAWLEKQYETFTKKDVDDAYASKELLNWVESLKYRVQPQPKQERSEEDENRINRLIAYFEDKESFTAEDDVVYVNWLKSLKERYTWKPSDEQMTQLKKYCPDNRPLTSLYEQLKKLKGE